ncbi:hypothetical protein N9893_02065, partial [bacterium]|nr:hypothetical protein [bacterium]
MVTPSLVVNEANVFLKKLDENLVEQWSIIERLDTVFSLSVDQNEAIYISGKFRDSSVVNFPNDTLVSTANSQDILLKYNASGNLVWHQEIETNSAKDSKRSNGVFADQLGNVFMIGTFGRESSGTNSVTVGGTTAVGFEDEDIYHAKFDGAGNVIWLQTTGDTLLDIGVDIVAKDGDHAYVTGYYFKQVFFGNNVLENVVGLKAFFAEVDPCPELLVSIVEPTNIEVCQDEVIELQASVTTGINYQWYFNGLLLTDSTASTMVADSTGFYQVQINDGGQCEKLSHEQSLVFNPLPDNSMVLSDSTLLCEGERLNLSLDYKPDYTYRWYFNNALSTAEVGSIYKDTISGEIYAELETSLGCVATTETITSTFLGTPATDFTASGNLDFCEGDSVVFSVVEQANHTYQWTLDRDSIVGATTTELIVKTAGDYALIVSNEANCQATAQDTSVVTISSPTSPIEALGATSFCDGEEALLVTDQFLGLSFQWYKGGIAILNDTTNTYKAIETGT